MHVYTPIRMQTYVYLVYVPVVSCSRILYTDIQTGRRKTHEQTHKRRSKQAKASFVHGLQVCRRHPEGAAIKRQRAKYILVQRHAPAHGKSPRDRDGQRLWGLLWGCDTVACHRMLALCPTGFPLCERVTVIVGADAPLSTAASPDPSAHYCEAVPHKAQRRLR